MKIVEISRSDIDRYNAVDQLRKGGWTEIGSGGYGTVYAKEGSPYVLKIFSKNDDGYLAYIKLVFAHRNIHFPVFHKKLIKVNEEYFAIRMEKLTRFDGSEQTIAFISNYLSNISLDTPENKKKSYKDFDMYIGQWGMIQNAIYFMNKPENQELKIACQLIASINAEFDIKRANIMMRNNTLVFVDPLCGGLWD